MSYLVGILAMIFFLDLDIFSDPNLISNFANPDVVTGLKILQAANVIGTFILPVLIFAYLVSDQWKKYLLLDRNPGLLASLSVIFMIVLAQPWINFSVSLNEAMSLPDLLSGMESWMKEKEESAAQITEHFLYMENPGDLIVNVLLIGLSAALGEELFFRGLLQPFFQRKTGNKHVAVWVTAILFSAIHLQFYGFIPRMLLGALFGYLLVWSGSLWLPILAHFVNNAGAVLATYYFSENESGLRIDEVGSSSDDWLYLLLTAPLLVMSIVVIYRRRLRLSALRSDQA